MKKEVWLLIFALTLAECARTVYRRNSTSTTESPKKDSRYSRYTNSKPSSSNSKPRVLSSRQQRGEVLENLFTVYDPSFLAVVWPRISNGVHLFVEPQCYDHLGVFFRDLTNGRAWAYRAVDASGRYQSSLFQGNRFWLGSKEECLELDDSFLSRDENNDTAALDEFQNSKYLNAILRREKYFNGGTEEWRDLVHNDELMQRLVQADHRPPYRLRYAASRLSFNLTKLTMWETYDITLGVCLPRSCRLEDITSVINFSIMINDNFKSNKSLPRALKVTSLRTIDRFYDVTNDIGAIALISVTIFIIALTMIATAVDTKVIKCRRRNRTAMSFDLQKIDNNYNNLSRARTLDVNKRNQHYDYLTRKQNIVDLESLTINNMNNLNIQKVTKPSVMAPTISLDVSMDRLTGSCKRCGKYKKQCNSVSQSPRFQENLPACPRVKSIASLTVDHMKKESFCRSVLMCFSLRRSWRKVFNTNMANKDLAVIHLLRIIGIFWIIFIHVAMIVNYTSEDGGDVNNHNNAYYILATGTLAFDTLFFVSGTFSAHHFFFLKAQYSVEELVSCVGIGGQLLQVICFVTNRAVRLLPSYAYTIFLSSLLARVTLHTSPLSLPEADDVTCDQYWWRNLLYITTAFPADQQCMQVSWYMTLDTQLHIVGAVVCALLFCGRRTVFVCSLAGVLVALAADISGAYYEFHVHFANVYSLYWTTIVRPLGRAAPYFAGLFTGWLVHKMDGGIRLSKSKSSILWMLSVVCLVTCLFTPRLGATWVTSWLHGAWPAAMLWPCNVLATNHADRTRRLLNSSWVAALSRLSYSMLVLHGPVARLLLLSEDLALCSQTVCVWSYFAGTAVVTALAALLMSVLVETPCCSLLRRISDCAT